MKKLLFTLFILTASCLILLTACTKEQETTVQECEDCTYGDWITVTEVSCSAEGEEYRVCSVCGTEEWIYIEKSDHDMSSKEVLVAPSCTKEGLELLECNNCDHTEEKSIPTIAHTEIIDNAIAPTCTTAGLSEGKHCSVCNTITVKQETLKAKGHNEVVDKAVSATCTTTGLSEGKYCSVCNTVTVKQKTVMAKGHNEVVDKAVSATCTKTGLTEGKHCSVCSAVTVEQKKLPAEHKAPYGICTICNKITDERAAISHYIDVDTSVARGKTCTTYYKNALNVQYYISYVSYDISMINTYNGGIMITVDFEIDARVTKTGSYYSGTGFLTYVISLGTQTQKSGYTSVSGGSATLHTSIVLDSIEKLNAYGRYPCFFVNVGDYYM